MARLNNKVKVILLVLMTLCSVIYIYKTYFNQPSCDGDRFTDALCKQYSQQAITGTLCEELCSRKTLVLSQCTLDVHGYRIFHQHGFDIKVSSGLFSSEKLVLKKYFREPSLGQTTDEFNQMLLSFIEKRLGPGDHESFVKELISFGDSNRDGQLTLAEAKSLWAILQHREFLMSFVLRHQNSRLVTPPYGFCGDLVAVEPIAVREIHGPPVSASSSSSFYPLVAAAASSSWPSVQIRARHSLELVGFVEALSGNEDHGLYVCSNTSVLDLYGLDEKGVVRMRNFGDIFSRHELEGRYGKGQCQTTADCVAATASYRCQQACTVGTSSCPITSIIAQEICQVIVRYLLPEVSAGSMSLLGAMNYEGSRDVLKDCLKLGSSLVEDQRMFIIDELRSSILRITAKNESDHH